MGKVNGDKMLVNEIKAGNQIAFEAMVIKYQPKLLSSLISYTKSIDRLYLTADTGSRDDNVDVNSKFLSLSNFDTLSISCSNHMLLSRSQFTPSITLAALTPLTALETLVSNVHKLLF